MKQRSITIIGGGAIGGISAAYLTRDGFDVTVVDTWKEHVAAMAGGVRVDGHRGEFSIPLKAIEPQQLQGPLDLVLLAVKSVSTAAALETVAPLLRDSSTVVSLQNSVNEDQIAAAVGAERTVGCMIGWGATSVGPGHLTQTSPGEFVLGGLNGETGGVVAEVTDILSHVTESHSTANIYGHLWIKLIGNCAIATGALLGKTVGETVSMEETHPVIGAIVSEGLEIAAALEIKLETVHQALEPEQYLHLKDFVAQSIIQLLANEHAGIFPSIYQDILKGRPCEIDFINGYVVKRGKEKGLPTPVNEELVKIIHEIESGTTAVGMENFQRLAKLL